MSNVITESIMTIAIIIAASMVATTMIQSLYDMEIGNKVLLNNIKESILTKLKIIFVTNISSNELRIWIKNIGKKEIDYKFIEKFSIFLGKRGDIKYIPFGDSSKPFWNYSLINNSILNPYETMEITVFLDSYIEPGDWYVRIITPLSEILEYEFSIGG
ncbi:MAG: hypothetical protein QXW62_00685 [Candidatus Methanomethylicaceae archaeon]|nr:hypothetical protein [Candidatus Verstraetearchaeota archaeon]